MHESGNTKSTRPAGQSVRILQPKGRDLRYRLATGIIATARAQSRGSLMPDPFTPLLKPVPSFMCPVFTGGYVRSDHGQAQPSLFDPPAAGFMSGGHYCTLLAKVLYVCHLEV